MLIYIYKDLHAWGRDENGQGDGYRASSLFVVLPSQIARKVDIRPRASSRFFPHRPPEKLASLIPLCLYRVRAFLGVRLDLVKTLL